MKSTIIAAIIVAAIDSVRIASGVSPVHAISAGATRYAQPHDAVCWENAEDCHSGGTCLIDLFDVSVFR